MPRALFPRTLVVLLLLGAPAAARAGEDPAGLARAVEEASFPDEKKAAVKKLLATGKAAVKPLLALVESTDGWTRSAAAWGLTVLGDAEADKVLVEKLAAGDLKDEVVTALSDRKTPFPVELLVARARQAEPAPDRFALVAVVGAIPGDASRRFLVETVTKTSPDEFRGADLKRAAFEALVKGHRAGLRPTALELVRDKEVGGAAFAFVVETGTAADLPLALTLIRDKDDAVAVVAFDAVAKWGDDKLKLATYLEALKGGSEARARGAISTFGSFRGPEITRELCRLVRVGHEQRTRLDAAGRLAASHPAAPGARDPVVPCLILALREVFDDKDDTPFLVHLLTLGMTKAIDALNRHYDRKRFDETLEAIGGALEARTGAKHGTDHEAWRDWALGRGYTVTGTNLLQQIFSPERARRAKAQEAAARFLGFASRDDFVRKNPGLAADKDADVGVALAKKLAEKGILEDEGD